MICPNCYAINSDTQKTCIVCKKAMEFDLVECYRSVDPVDTLRRQMGISKDDFERLMQ